MNSLLPPPLTFVAFAFLYVTMVSIPTFREDSTLILKKGDYCMQIFSTNSKSGDIQVHNSKKVQSFKFQLNQGKIKDFRYFHGFHFIRKVPLFSMKMI